MTTNWEKTEKEFDNIIGEKHHKVCMGKNCVCHFEQRRFLKAKIEKIMDDIIGKRPIGFSDDNTFIGYCIKEKMLKDYKKKFFK